MMRIVFNSAKLFDIRDVKISFFLKKSLYCGWGKNMLRQEIVLFEEDFAEGSKSLSDSDINRDWE